MLSLVLVFEKRSEVAERLASVLRHAGVETIMLVSTTREAVMAIDRQPYDLAIIPLEYGLQLLRPLRALQPDLPIILSASAADTTLPPGSQDTFQGILHTSVLEGELPTLLAGFQPVERLPFEKLTPGPVEIKPESQTTEAPAAEPEATLPRPAPAQRPDVTQAVFDAACRAAGLSEAVRQVILSRGSQLLLWGEAAADDQGKAVATAVNRSWTGKESKAQIQYWQDPGTTEPWLLYTRPAARGLLTLIASADASIGDIRMSSDRLLVQIARVVESGQIKDRPPDNQPPGFGASGAANKGSGPIALPPAGSQIDIALPAKAGKSITHSRRTAIFGVLFFLLKRLAFGLVVLLAIIFLTYFGLNMARGIDAGEAAVDAVYETIAYIGRLLQGDLGTTSAGSDTLLSIPVSQVIKERLPRSLALLGISLLIASIIGVILGVSAARRGAKHSLGVIVTTIIGVSVPSFFAAFLLQWAVTTYTRSTGRTLIPVGGFGWDSHMILPIIVLAARPLAQITRITFVSVKQVLLQDYVRTAYSKGLREFQVLSQHVLRNAAIPILTTIGVSLRFSLAILPVVEIYFGWPGIGFTLVGSIALQDDDLTVALLLCLGIIFIVVNILLELSYRFIDPRIAETPAYLGVGRKQGTFESAKDLAGEVRDYLSDNAVTRWLKSASGRQPLETLPPLVPRSDSQLERAALAAQPFKPRVDWSAVWRNLPLMVGGLLILLLLVVVLFGAYLVPHSPYATKGLEIVDGQISVPPFAPGAEFPWGTDVLGRDLASLILAGAQLTLSLALLVVVTRMVLGIVLGAVAGWSNGSWLDRLIMGLSEVIAAFPTLLLAMVLILALGIRQGVGPFIVGLGLVGWGETMQFVRGEVTTIRPKSFIESAIAIGARTPRIIGRHIMPNLLSSLISIFALEMGAVLMLLGELGFLSIFIGGGAYYELETFAAPYHYSDVPEWGALLSNIRTYSRAYPWLALYPTLAFFVAILAFNLFGEGIRRLVDDGSLVINRLVNRYTIAAAVAAMLVFVWLRGNSGPIAFYKQHAEAFDGRAAQSTVADLTDPLLEGRAVGTAGQNQAAAYIADRFEALGLQPAGESQTYFQERFRSFEVLESFPKFTIDDGQDQPVYEEDFAAYPGRYFTSGEISGPVRAITLGQPLPIAGFGGSLRYPNLRTADFSDQVLLVLSDSDALAMQNAPYGGLLVVADDPSLFDRRFTLSGRSQAFLNPLTGLDKGQATPSLWISEEVANRILAGTGKTVEILRQESEQLELASVNEIETGTDVTMAVEGTLEERVPVYNVIGHLPGKASTPGESQMDQRLILVLAQYDSPPPGPEGAYYPAANDNGSGVAVMLEAIRVMMETEYEPNKTFLFVAYSGEGLEGGESVSNPDITKFLQAKSGFATFLEPEAIVYLRGLGGGSGDRLEVSSGGSLRLAELFEAAARQVGAKTVRRDEPIDISIIYSEGTPYQSAQDAPEVRLTWQGWDEHARLLSDTLEQISADNLEDAGRTLALALMIMGRERDY